MTDFLFAYGEHVAQSLASNETGILGRDSSIVSTVTTGIYANGFNIDLRINGQVLALARDGIVLFGQSSSFDRINLSIGTTGVIEAGGGASSPLVGIAIVNTTSGSFTNAGWVSGEATGAYLAANVTGTILAMNSGVIQGMQAGVEIGDLGTIQLTNSGTIRGDSYGISASFFGDPSDAILHLTNTGTISGGDFSIRTGAGADVIVNHGTLNGAIALNAGNDNFDNRGGTVYGSIDMGLGNDWFTAGLSAETVNGGGGVDTLSFYASLTGVTVALDESIANTGAAAGDDYISFEILRGSKFGADRFIGTTANETFWGNGGADSLSGAAGVDALIGGAGIDRLSGGAGNDKFIFYATTEGGDLISDFGNAGTNDDQIRIKASGFGGGLVAGALSASQFIVRADHAAQDSNDRFIFNTVDHSLWFDRDGNGTAAAVLVADLQNTSAIMTAADILIF